MVIPNEQRVTKNDEVLALTRRAGAILLPCFVIFRLFGITKLHSKCLAGQQNGRQQNVQISVGRPRHLRQWLTNLRRASHERKLESVAALRAVIVAARQTQVYLRQLHDNGKPDHRKEEELTKLWTTLGFRLADLKLTKLSKRCDITGRYWADPTRLDNDFLAKADIGLDRMEKLALQLLNDVNK